MAVLTGGSITTTNLSALEFPSFAKAGLSDADVASINARIINDASPPQGVPGAFTRGGLLYIPNRGVLKMLPGDWVLVTNAGWPMLASPIAMGTTVTLIGTDVIGSNILTLTTSAFLAGWQIGGSISGTGIGARALITNISPDGLTLTLSGVATSSNAGITITYGAFTHS